MQLRKRTRIPRLVAPDSERHRAERTLSEVDGLVFRNPETDRVLVVLTPENPEESLKNALAEPTMVPDSADVILVLPTAEYEARRRARIEAGVDSPYSIDQLAEEARAIAKRVGCEYLGLVGVDFEAIGGVGRTRDLVIDAVRENEYTKVFVSSPRRTIWQRLLGSEETTTDIASGLQGIEVVPVPVGDASPGETVDTDVVALIKSGKDDSNAPA